MSVQTVCDAITVTNHFIGLLKKDRKQYLNEERRIIRQAKRAHHICVSLKFWYIYIIDILCVENNTGPGGGITHRQGVGAEMSMY